MKKPEGKRLYPAETLILYGRTGVCRVEGVIERTLSGEKGPIPFYFLRPLYQSNTISAPVEKVEDGMIFSRALMDHRRRSLLKHCPAGGAIPQSESESAP